MSDTDIYSGLTQLGAAAPIPQRPEDAVLEKVANPQPNTDYMVRFTAPWNGPMTGHTAKAAKSTRLTLSGNG